MAKECFLRRREGEHLWVDRRADIHSFTDESLLEIAADKSYRFPEAYRDVVTKREKAKDARQEIVSERDACVKQGPRLSAPALGDDELVLGHRHSEWTGFAPHIEEDVAFSSIAQDEIGHAANYYMLLGVR